MRHSVELNDQRQQDGRTKNTYFVPPNKPYKFKGVGQGKDDIQSGVERGKVEYLRQVQDGHVRSSNGN